MNTTQEIQQVEGVAFRAFRGPDDYPPLHANRHCLGKGPGLGDERVETVEGIASRYEKLERCDPYRDLVSRRGGRPPRGI